MARFYLRRLRGELAAQDGDGAGPGEAGVALLEREEAAPAPEPEPGEEPAVLPGEPALPPHESLPESPPVEAPPPRRRSRVRAAEQVAVEAILTEDVAAVTGVGAETEPAPPPADVAEEIAVQAILTEDVAAVTGVSAGVDISEADMPEVPPGEDDATSGALEPEAHEQTSAPRRRRRRRRGHGRPGAETTAAEAAGILPGEPELPPETAEESPDFLPEVPPSSHLTTMLQRGGLVLPEPRGRRRRGRGAGGDRAREEGDGRAAVNGADLVEQEPAARLLEAPERGSRARLSPLEELIARQNVVFDQLMQRQTAMLRALERMMTVLERRGGGGGGEATLVAPPRVAVFVDVPNIVFAAERIGVTIDWGKVLHYLTRDRQLVRASAYAPVSDDPYQRIELQKFVQPFYSLPYRILTKPLKRFGNGEIKANFDVELAIDVITMADRLDIVCLVSGDGDFRRMVELVQSKGVRVEVIAFSSSTAGELRAACDEFVDFSQHLHEFCVTR